MSIPIKRITGHIPENIKELKGTLRISHMIPVPGSELIAYDVDAEQDENYRNLVRDELVFIRRKKEKIASYAKVMYKQKAENYAAGYVNSALDYKELEKLCKKYEK